MEEKERNKRNSYRFMVGGPEGNNHLEHLRVDGLYWNGCQMKRVEGEMDLFMWISTRIRNGLS